MRPAHILYPVAAMLGLTCIVMAAMLRERVAEIKARKLHLREIPTSSKMNVVLENTRAADNYKNLFEMPVLFYALAVALFAANMASPVFVGLAWLYVALRCAHSCVHVTYNKIRHRFNLFVASSAVLVLMWGGFIFQLVRYS
jgi:hypothetical protein